MVKDIYHFVTTTPTLDKTLIGEYFGEEKDINKEVLYYYIDSFNFS